jgi:tRNA(Ile)-lysidine synthase
MANSRKRSHADLAAHLQDFLEPILPSCRRIALALSGGLDSSVLLHLLGTLRFRLDFTLSAVHVDHGISPNAARWAEFCRVLCAEAGVPIQVISVSVSRDGGLGLEAEARAARYRVLFEQEVDALVLAHHQDDQAETLLLQLLRGAGLKGLAGMPPMARRQDKWLLRPLLDVSRAELLVYARAHGLAWIEDESNADLAYPRNFLRHRILPQLTRRFPAAGRTLARSAAHLAEASELLEEVAQADAQGTVRDGQLDLGRLQALSRPRALNLLRWWIARQTGNAIPARRLDEIYRQLVSAAPDARVRFVIGSHALVRYRNHAWMVAAAPQTVPACLDWHGESELAWGSGGWLSFRSTTGRGLALRRLGQGRVSIRSRQGGERFRSAPGPRHTLKSLLQQAGIPPWQRLTLPLIYCDEHLVMVPGIGLDPEFAAQNDEPSLAIEWHRADT